MREEEWGESRNDTMLMEYASVHMGTEQEVQSPRGPLVLLIGGLSVHGGVLGASKQC